MNLIRNGVESGARSILVEVDTAADEAGIRIAFVDDGPGVDPEVAHRLFEPFYTTRIEDGGTGLGLSVAHGVVEEHDGRLSYARRRAPDASRAGLDGAAFSVWLPWEATPPIA